MIDTEVEDVHVSVSVCGGIQLLIITFLLKWMFGGSNRGDDYQKVERGNPGPTLQGPEEKRDFGRSRSLCSLHIWQIGEPHLHMHVGFIYLIS